MRATGWTLFGLLLANATGLGLALGDGDVAPVARAEVEKLHRELIPAKTEPWETIGWRTDLLAAREEAVKAGKPLFLWAMNGHPLGCV